MKKLLILLMLLVPSLVYAKTATVTYTYTGDPTDTVAVMVSETPDFSQALADGATITGQMDTDKDGVITIGNLVPGNTYYFAPVAWDVNNVRTPFGAEMMVAIPTVPPFILTEYPPIAIEGRTITFSVTVE